MINVPERIAIVITIFNVKIALFAFRLKMHTTTNVRLTVASPAVARG